MIPKTERRKIMARKIPSRHRISKHEAIDFMSKNFKVMVGEE